MYQQKSIFTIAGIVIELLFLAFMAFCFGDYVLFCIRSGQFPAFVYIINALVVFVPGIILIWAYNEYRMGSFTAFDNIARCAVVNAVLDALPLVPVIGPNIYGVSPIAGLRHFYLRFFDLSFGPTGTMLIYLLAFIAQTLLPFAIIGILEGKEYLQVHGLKEVGILPLQILGTLLVIWLGIQAAVAILNSGVFDRSIVFVGFFPIPGQLIGVFLPVGVAIGAIIAIWTKPWEK